MPAATRSSSATLNRSLISASTTFPPLSLMKRSISMSSGLRVAGSSAGGRLLLRATYAAAAASTTKATIARAISEVGDWEGLPEVVLEDITDNAPDVDAADVVEIVDALDPLEPVAPELEVWVCDVSMGRP